MRAKTDRTAFTLIEVSIVLVIIGLIIGGILLGQDLMASSTNRKMVSDFQKLSTAFRTFYTKYNCLPGDCVNASQLGFTGICQTNYVGDGLIGAAVPPVNSFLWPYDIIPGMRQLSTANLIEGGYDQYTMCSGMTLAPGSHFPAMANGQLGYVVISFVGKNYIRTGISPSTYSNVSLESLGYSLSPVEAYYIATKIGSGTPGVAGSKFFVTGIATGGVPNNDFWTAPTFSAAGGTGCVVGSAPLVAGQEFNLSNKDRRCNLFMELQ